MSKKKSFWDRLAKHYDRLNSKYEAQYRDTIAITKKYLEPDHVILDYGCGTGITTLELAASVKQVMAVDISESMLEMARIKSLEKQIRNIEFISTDILDTSYDRKRFDMVLVFNTLQYIKNAEKVMERIYSLLSPGGLFISVTDCYGEKPSPGLLLMKHLSGTGLFPYMRHYTMAGLEDSIKQHGFEISKAWNLNPRLPNYLIVAEKSIAKQ